MKTNFKKSVVLILESKDALPLEIWWFLKTRFLYILFSKFDYRNKRCSLVIIYSVMAYS